MLTGFRREFEGRTAVGYNGGMPSEGRTGVVIPVPEAQELLASVASRHPEAVRPGVPAHVSVLYPFLRQFDDEVLAALRELFAGRSAIPVRFAECRRRGGFVHLRPSPDDQLRALTAEAMRRWPDVPPYEGKYEPEPHLTLATNVPDDTATAIAREVAAELPVVAELSEAWLVVFDGERWTRRERFAFGG